MHVASVGRRALLASVVVGVTAAVCADLLLFDKVFFSAPAPSYSEDLPGLFHLETADGERIAARWIETPGAEITVLYAHGNAEDLGGSRRFTERYASIGVSVLTFDYPGFGLSTGRPTEKGTYAAADVAYRWLRDHEGILPKAVIAHGRSLGAAVAVDLASREPLGGLIIESGFVSAYRMLTRIPLVPRDRFMSASKLQDVQAPVLVIHGGRDEIVAYWHGRRLFDALPPERRSALWVQRAGHNDLVRVAGSRYWAALEGMVAEVSGAASR